MNEKLRELGQRAGILPEYVTFDGTKRVQTSDRTYHAILQCMGYRVDDEASIKAAFPSLDDVDQPGALPLEKCVSCTERSGKRQFRGIWTNLYSIRSQANLGVGDFGDLKKLIVWAGELGLDFVAINPLHALRNRGHDVSPYRPVSRLFRNEIYLELGAVPGFDPRMDASASDRSAAAGKWINYEQVWGTKRSVLRTLHGLFCKTERDSASFRGQQYEQFLENEGAALRDFATFMAIDEYFACAESGHREWRNWPNGLSDVQSHAVTEFRNTHAHEIDFHCWVQFELDRQFAALADLAREVGLDIGLFGDLAIGASPDGSDPWSFPDLHLDGVSIGAPPDELGPAGQNWGLPPLHPHKLAEFDFDFWRRLLRRNLLHCGALRLDHVMGLHRQFWIPDGMEGPDGAYVRFPDEQLFTILAQESRRRGTIIVGEDLGTVPEGFRELMQRFGALSTRVLYFEREWDGRFRSPASYPADAYAVVSTHDMVPLGGFPAGRDLQLRQNVGLIPDDASLERALEARRRDWLLLLETLKAHGFRVDNQEGTGPDVRAALAGFLADTPSCMVGISLDDLAGEQEPVNVPGVGQDQYPSWSRRMTMPLEDIISSPSIREAVRAATSRH